MSRIGEAMPKEYSDTFDLLRQNRVETAYYMRGTAADVFGTKCVNAVKTCLLYLDKYEETGNTEYLCDAANYLMYEYMYPRHKNAHFRNRGPGESAKIIGDVSDLERFLQERGEN